MPEHVDIVLLTRDASAIREDVLAAIEAQVSVIPQIHRVIGTPLEDDAHRWQTIARARNEGKKLGSSPWLMFVDDDVVLGRGCVASLLQTLQARVEFAAFAADYCHEMKAGRGNSDYPRHVGMGATLFRRKPLETVTFRWEDKKCECQCCCDDLRRAGYGIGYLPGAIAWHKPDSSKQLQGPNANSGRTCENSNPSGRVLVAFDHHHFPKFHRQFLRTLRSTGNGERVTAVTYGLRPADYRLLSKLENVEFFPSPNPRAHPSYARIRDFQNVIANWPDNTPVAFWDAGDVLFQGRIDDLWGLVRAHPGELLVVPEPFRYPENPAISAWTSSIRNFKAGRRAFELLSTNPFLNAGFIASSAGALFRYLVEAERLIDSAAIRGLGFGADQVALNLYCHSNLGPWRAIPEAWNYCLAGRDAHEFRLRKDGYTVSSSGLPVHVVHGNAGSLRGIEWYFQFKSTSPVS
jgi:hypothetical protein